jgi:SAM-dependent methyltransferase
MTVRSRLLARLGPDPRAAREAADRACDERLAAALLARPEPPADERAGRVTEALYARLAPEDVAEVERVVDGDARMLWASAGPDARRRMALICSTYYELPEAMARTGLRPDMPPEDVHAMAHNWVAAGGAPAIADVVADGLARAGFAIADGDAVLDFGCSSGRVLRVLAAWRPEVEWLGCDPNEAAIAWAQEHLGDLARFFAGPARPPLELTDGSVAAAYAISIWSHFDAEPALEWLEEMHRIVRPGGALLLSTHGLDTLAGNLRSGRMEPAAAARTAEALLASGHRFEAVFGEQGDWGVRDPGWGAAHLTPEWLARHATPRWAVRLYEPAGLERDQDVIVLERR